MRYLFRFALILSLVIISLYTTPASRAQDQPDCCFQIYSTGRFLGWGAALLEYTRPRNAPSQFDEIIYRQLQEASNTLASSYNSCDGFIEAWPSWQQKQSWLSYQISELQKDINHQFKRGRVYQQVAQTYNTWGNELSIMKVNNINVNTVTCATCYFRLGYASAYISQALRQADEAVNRNNNWDEAGRQMKLAREHLQRIMKILRSYREVQQPKGSFIVRCANLDSLDLGNQISRLYEACGSIDNLTSKIQKANFLSDEIGRVLLEDCFPPWDNDNSTPNPPGSNGTPNPTGSNVQKWLGKTWRVRSDWGAQAWKNTSWYFTVGNHDGICEVTVRGTKKFRCTIDQNNHLKWTDKSGTPHKIADLEFWLTANGTIAGKFEGIGRDNKSFSGAYNAE